MKHTHAHTHARTHTHIHTQAGRHARTHARTHTHTIVTRTINKTEWPWPKLQVTRPWPTHNFSPFYGFFVVVVLRHQTRSVCFPTDHGLIMRRVWRVHHLHFQRDVNGLDPAKAPPAWPLTHLQRQPFPWRRLAWSPCWPAGSACCEPGTRWAWRSTSRRPSTRRWCASLPTRRHRSTSPA